MMRCLAYKGRLQHVQPQKGRNNKPTRGGGDHSLVNEETGRQRRRKQGKQTKQNQQMVEKLQGHCRSEIKEYGPLNTRRDDYKLRWGWLGAGEGGRGGIGETQADRSGKKWRKDKANDCPLSKLRRRAGE